MDVPMLVGVVAVSALIAWILFYIGRSAIVAAEHRSQSSTLAEHPDADPELLHALRVLHKRMSLAAYICGAGLAGFGAGAVQWSDLGSAGKTATIAVLLVALAIPLVFVPRPVAAAYARARGVPRAQLSSRRTTIVRVSFLLIWAWPLPVAYIVETTLPNRVLGLAVADLLVVPVVIGLLAPVLARILAPDQVPPELGPRLSALSSRAGVHLGATRVMRARARKVANAAQLGWLPGLQSIVITDYLIDSMSAPDVDAVFAHEVGHARCHHNRIRSAISGALYFCLGCTLMGLIGHAPNFLLSFGGLAAAALLIRAYRRLAVRQEIAADDVAAAIVGPGQLAGAFDRLSTVNALKRDTSAKWDRQVGHPGMAIRIARLEAQELAGHPNTVPGTMQAVPDTAP